MKKSFKNLRKYYENKYKKHSFSLYYIKTDAYKNYMVQHTLNVIKKLKKLKKFSNLTILDIGCADGFFTSYFAKLKGDTVGIDINTIEISRAKKKPTNFSFCVGDAQNLNFVNESFDVVFCKDVLEHLPNDKICCDEIFRVLKVGGFAIISVPTRDTTSISRFLIKLTRLVRFFEKFKASISQEDILAGQSKLEHLHKYSLHSICRLLETTGIKLIGIESFGFVFPFYQKFIRCFPPTGKLFDAIGKRLPNLADSTFIITKKINSV